MAIIIYGTKTVPIRADEFLIKCPNCGTSNWADVLGISHYFHLYFLPIFPTQKEAIVICETCKSKRHGLKFDQNLIDNYQEVKSKYRHSWLLYTGLIITVLGFAGIILSANFIK